MNRHFSCLAGLLLISSASAQEDIVLSFNSRTHFSFDDSVSAEPWTGGSQTTVESGIPDGAFPDSPVLQATVVPGSPAGANIRPSLQFSPVVLDQPNEFIRMRLKLRFASGMLADRRLQTAFWNSATTSGYLSYAKAGSTGTFSGNLLRQTAIPELGVMNAGGTNLPSTGDRAVSLGTSQTVIRDATLLVYLKADGTMAVRSSCTNDNGEPLTLDAVDGDGTLNTFDRFDLTVWGNTVNINIDEAELSNGILIPPGQWGGSSSVEWSDSLNWTDNTVPAENARLVFGSAFTSESHNNLAAGTAFNGLEFPSTASEYTISGNAVRMAGIIRNSSSAGQLISLPMVLTSPLQVRTSAGPVALTGPISGAHGLIKSGGQTLTLSGDNTYTGSTTVKAGILALTKAVLNDTAALEVATGASAALDFEGTDTVGSLILGGETLAEGTYSAATHPDFLTGVGSITLSSVPSSAYSSWIGGFAGLGAGADKTPGGDPDGDGMPNYQEFAFDSNPSSRNAFSGYVKLEGGYLTLTVPVRAGATWSGTGPVVSSVVEGISYRLEGGTDPAAAFSAPVLETAALSAGLPAPRAGWEYHTFRLGTAVAESPRGFLRTAVTRQP